MHVSFGIKHRCSLKKGVLPQACKFVLRKYSNTGVFSSEICEIFKIKFFTEYKNFEIAREIKNF